MTRTGIVNGRFQVLHLKHMEYILAAKMRCDKLYIGITNPDGAHTRDTVHDENRGTKAGNPLTYFERCEMIRGAMEEFGVPAKEYDFIPFPINTPEYIAQYTPEEAVYYVGMFDAWDEEKYKILRSLDLNVNVLWRKTEEEKGITASKVRELIATDQEWKQFVPKSVYHYLKENELDKRIKRLELMRIEEKEIQAGASDGQISGESIENGKLSDMNLENAGDNTKVPNVPCVEDADNINVSDASDQIPIVESVNIAEAVERLEIMESRDMD